MYGYIYYTMKSISTLLIFFSSLFCFFSGIEMDVKVKIIIKTIIFLYYVILILIINQTIYLISFYKMIKVQFKL